MNITMPRRNRFSRALQTFLLLEALAVTGHASRLQADLQTAGLFNAPVQVSGQMIRNQINFDNELQLNVFSPSNQTVTVVKNNTPLPVQYISGTTGGNYRALTPYSYVVQTGSQAVDLIAELDIAYDPVKLLAFNVDPSNAFVVKLATDNSSWVNVPSRTTVDMTSFIAQVGQLTNIDGEYALVGRVGNSTGTVLADFGQTPDKAVAIVAGGPQEVQYIDGLKLSVVSDVNMSVNVDFSDPITKDMVPQGMRSLYAYGYVVNSTMSSSGAPLTPVPDASQGNNLPPAGALISATPGSDSSAVPSAVAVSSDVGAVPSAVAVSSDVEAVPSIAAVSSDAGAVPSVVAVASDAAAVPSSLPLLASDAPVLSVDVASSVNVASIETPAPAVPLSDSTSMAVPTSVAVASVDSSVVSALSVAFSAPVSSAINSVVSGGIVGVAPAAAVPTSQELSFIASSSSIDQASSQLAAVASSSLIPASSQVAAAASTSIDQASSQVAVAASVNTPGSTVVISFVPAQTSSPVAGVELNSAAPTIIQPVTVVISPVPAATSVLAAVPVPAVQPSQVSSSPGSSNRGNGNRGNNNNGPSDNNHGNNNGNRQPSGSAPSGNSGPFGGAWGPFSGWAIGWGSQGHSPSSSSKPDDRRSHRLLRFMKRGETLTALPASCPVGAVNCVAASNAIASPTSAPVDGSAPYSIVAASASALDVSASYPTAAPPAAPVDGGSPSSIVASIDASSIQSSAPTSIIASIDSSAPSPSPSQDPNVIYAPSSPPADASLGSPELPPLPTAVNSTGPVAPDTSSLPASPPAAPPSPIKALQLSIPLNTALLHALLGDSPFTSTTGQSQGQSLLSLGATDTLDAQLRGIAFSVGRRDVGAKSPFVALTEVQGGSNGVSLVIDQGKLMVTGLGGLASVDGEYVVLVPDTSSTGGAVGVGPAAVNNSANSAVGLRRGMGGMIWGIVAILGGLMVL